MHDYQKAMNSEVALLKESIENLKKQKKELKKVPDLTAQDILREERKIEKRIQHSKDQIKLYDTKKVDLRKTGEFILNMKLYNEFLKKIKGMHYLVKIGEAGIEVHYGKTHELKAGKLIFYNLAEHYSTFAGIPALEEVVELGQTQIA